MWGVIASSDGVGSSSPRVAPRPVAATVGACAPSDAASKPLPIIPSPPVSNSRPYTDVDRHRESVAIIGAAMSVPSPGVRREPAPPTVEEAGSPPVAATSRQADRRVIASTDRADNGAGVAGNAIARGVGSDHGSETPSWVSPYQYEPAPPAGASRVFQAAGEAELVKVGGEEFDVISRNTTRVSKPIDSGKVDVQSFDVEVYVVLGSDNFDRISEAMYKSSDYAPCADSLQPGERRPQVPAVTQPQSHDPTAGSAQGRSGDVQPATAKEFEPAPTISLPVKPSPNGGVTPAPPTGPILPKVGDTTKNPIATTKAPTANPRTTAPRTPA